MPRPQILDLSQGNENYDSAVNTNFFTILRDGPFPIKSYASISALPSAGSYDQCLCVVFDDVDSNEWLIAVSNGSEWKFIGAQAAFQADSTATTIGALVADFNALLTKLKNSGLMEGS